MNTVIEFVKELLRKSPARVIAYGGGAAVASAIWLSGRLGVTLSPEAQAAILTLVTFALTEAIRRFVYSPNSVDEIQAQAAATGETPPLDAPP